MTKISFPSLWIKYQQEQLLSLLSACLARYWKRPISKTRSGDHVTVGYTIWVDGSEHCQRHGSEFANAVGRSVEPGSEHILSGTKLDVGVRDAEQYDFLLLLFLLCVHCYISGVHQFGWDVCVCGRFLLFYFIFIPTIEVVTFRLRG